MDCEQMSQVSVVQIGLQNYTLDNLTKNQNYKRPLYFINKPYNSLDFRFYTPKQSKALVYFLIDIGFEITCSQLKDSFEQWKKKTIGDLGPIMSVQGETFGFNTAKSEFHEVRGGSSKRYFNSNLMNGAWVSRFYLQLYYLQNCLQINSIRQIVIKQNDCEDIALNFIIYSFFPQFLPQLIKVKIASSKNENNKQQKINQLQVRNVCFKSFVNIIGFNPMRIIDKKSQTEPFRYQSEKFILYAKRIQLEMRMNNKKNQMFKNANSQKNLIQTIFKDEYLQSLIEDRRTKVQQLSRTRDTLVKIIFDKKRQNQKNWNIVIVFFSFFLAIMTFINFRLIKRYRNLKNVKNQKDEYQSVKEDVQHQLKRI